MIRTFFGWENTPFTKEIPTSALFRSEPFQECVARMQYMVQTRAVGCITGEIGAGKTTAVRYLQSRLDLTKHRFDYFVVRTTPIRD